MASIPSFHDAKLIGVALDGKRATLIVMQVNGEKWQVAIHDVQALQMDEFREGNIISYFEAVSGEKVPRNVLEILFTPPHPSAAEEYHAAHARLLDAKSALVQAGEAVLVMITPSYGAEFAAFGAAFDAFPVTIDGS
ncbi:hypothetical protein [Novosphingobium sp.]|uniref:hypothetical protein n=1 Tax=Novosphingobium sp. TaxID=1874826 RepID=UPI003B51B146